MISDWILEGVGRCRVLNIEFIWNGISRTIPNITMLTKIWIQNNLPRSWQSKIFLLLLSDQKKLRILYSSPVLSPFIQIIIFEENVFVWTQGCQPIDDFSPTNGQCIRECHSADRPIKSLVRPRGERDRLRITIGDARVVVNASRSASRRFSPFSFLPPSVRSLSPRKRGSTRGWRRIIIAGRGERTIDRSTISPFASRKFLSPGEGRSTILHLNTSEIFTIFRSVYRSWRKRLCERSILRYLYF